MGKSDRIKVRAILADPDLRRKLMVPTIQATQAREGVLTTREQAENAYYIVSERERGAFFALDKFRAKGESSDLRETEFVRALQSEPERTRIDVSLRDFGAVKGSPLAFGPIRTLQSLFREHSPLYPVFADTKIGHQTFDDDRFVRWWWEVRANDTGAGQKWPPFAKGGKFSRFYSDVSLVVRWDASAQAEYAVRVSNFNVLLTPSRDQYLFRAGLTWPRAASIFNVRKMPPGCVFADKGPAIYPTDAISIDDLSAILNSDVALFVCKALSSRGDAGGRWEAGIVRRIPMPRIPKEVSRKLSALAQTIETIKRKWDEGNEVATSFVRPGVLGFSASSLASSLDATLDFEQKEEARIQHLYAELNDAVYRLYGISDATRATIEETLGERPPEILWPQMEGKTADQKRMEHVWRLLSYAVKRVVEADDDGIVPFSPAAGEPRLVERVRQELGLLFPGHDPNQLEVEIANELKRSVKGYRKTASIAEWLDNVFFEYHAGLYRNRPIYWHLASAQGTAPFAFGVLIHYHRFDKDRMKKLRSSYLRDALKELKSEAALAAKDNRGEDRIEVQAKVEEAEAFDRKLQQIQEGAHEGPEGGDRDYRILTPWKAAADRPLGWDPDVDDGVKVNIDPLEKAGVLRITKVT